MGLQGRAENQTDGSVLIDVEGEEEKLNRLVEWCQKGPSGAKVEKVEVSEAPGQFVPLKTS